MDNIVTFVVERINLLLPLISITGFFFLILQVLVPQHKRVFTLSRIRNLLVGFYIVFPTVLSILQWRVWAGSSFGRILLSLPLNPTTPFPDFLRPLFGGQGGYFAFYVLGRFWLSTALLFLTAALLYGVFAALVHFRPSAVGKEEILVALIGCIISGWPGAVVYVPLLTIIAVFHGGVNQVRGLDKTSLVPASIIATLLILIAGHTLISFLHLSVLQL